MGSKSTPAPPDYRAAAEEQGRSSAANIEAQTRANRPTQNTPWGSSNWSQDAQGNWTQNISLNPNEQASLESQQRLQLDKSKLGESLTGRMSDEFGQPMDWNQFTEFGGIPQGETQGQIDTSGLQGVDSSQRYYDQAGDALYGRATSRLDPQWEQRAEATDVRLRNQGLRPGDQAYDDAIDNMERQRTDAYQQAGYGADIGAGSEASRMYGMDLGLRGQQFGERTAEGGFFNRAAGQEFGQDMTSSNLQSTQRQAEIAEEMRRRGFSLNEMNAIISGQQVGMPEMPGFTNSGAAEATNYLGAANMGWQSDLDQYGLKQAQQQGMWDTVGSIAGGAMAFSDRRLKTDIAPLGNGWYSYKLFGHIPQIGVMSDEHPEAVVRHPSGYDMVDYGVIYGS